MSRKDAHRLPAWPALKGQSLTPDPPGSVAVRASIPRVIMEPVRLVLPAALIRRGVVAFPSSFLLGSSVLNAILGYVNCYLETCAVV